MLDDGTENGEAAAPAAEIESTFPFASVPSGAEREAIEISRTMRLRKARRELTFNGMASVVAGVAPFVMEQWLSVRGLLRLPSPYPHFTRDPLLFYVGWALYWGFRDFAIGLRGDGRKPSREIRGVPFGSALVVSPLAG